MSSGTGSSRGSERKSGVPSFGHTAHLRVFIDPDLLQYGAMWAAAGAWSDVFPIAPHDLVHAGGAAVTGIER